MSDSQTYIAGNEEFPFVFGESIQKPALKSRLSSTLFGLLNALSLTQGLVYES